MVVNRKFQSVTERLSKERATHSSEVASPIAQIEEMIAAIGRGDYEAALRGAAPDVELEIYAPPEFPFITHARGIPQLVAAIRHNFESVVEQQPVITNVLAHGDVVVMLGSETGRIHASGTSYRVEFVHRFTFADRALQNIRIIVARAA
jgi:ketosteroid isomerase-like protein